MIRVHGTCVAIDGVGVLLRGSSGSGKSDMALRLIDEGAELVADDQVEIHLENNGLLAKPPATIAGLLEVRGLGIVRLNHQPCARLGLVVDLVAPEQVERLPEIGAVSFLDHPISRIAINPWETSATTKVRLAVRVEMGTIMLAQ
jgi:serine kinase of HPr protein (carbohydrate metabolism regulator)